MIALVGEQPMPNVLPVLQYQPDGVLLVDTSKTTHVAERLYRV
jgi:hypothetical protein